MNKQTQNELLNIVKKNYQEIVKHFSETREKYLWPELLKLTKSVPDKSKVLDAGCGNGRLVKAFLEKEIHYLGVDNSRDLIEQAKLKYVSEKIFLDNKVKLKIKSSDIDFKVADILDLGSIGDVDFDYVFSIAVLQHIPGRNLQIQVLRQLRNKIKKDGKIILSVWNMWSSEWETRGKSFRKQIFKFFLLRLIGKNKMDFGDIVFDWKNPKGEKVSRRYYHAFWKRELKKIIKKAGLRIEKIYKDKYNYYAVLRK
jgi:SAM-dependent methyltransferase